MFHAEGPVMRWACERCGGATGAKTYPTARDAHRFATAFNRRDNDGIGDRAPLIGLLPLRLWRRWHRS
jgi:hypothetical protein